jgi:hypothetical protein
VKCFAGSQRQIMYQHRTGVVCYFMLREILKRKSEHLWAELGDLLTSRNVLSTELVWGYRTKEVADDFLEPH